MNFILSIVIPTYERTREVRNLLHSIYLEKISYKYEILIIDQNEDDRLHDIIVEFENKLPVYWHKVSFKGLSKARNYGTQHARGGVISFPDDDAEFGLGTINKALNYMKEKNADCVFGKCIDKSSGRNTMLKFGNKKIQLDFHNFEHNSIEAAMFVKRTVALRYPFDEKMGVGCIFGSQEGYDIVYRMLSHKCRLFYSPDIIFYHPSKVISRNTSLEIKRAFYYSCGYGHLCQKHQLTKKYLKRIGLLSAALPFIAFLKKDHMKYYCAQWMGLKLGYKYLS